MIYKITFFVLVCMFSLIIFAAVMDFDDDELIYKALMVTLGMAFVFELFMIPVCVFKMLFM